MRFGNYVHEYTEVLDFDSEEEASKACYYKALELCEETLYTYGFEPFSEEEAEEVENEEREAEEREYCENEAVYAVEVYVPEKHDDELY